VPFGCEGSNPSSGTSLTSGNASFKCPAYPPSRTVDRDARTKPGRAAACWQLLSECDGDVKRAESALRARLARAEMQANQAKRRAKAAAKAMAEIEAGEPDGG
jgi:hypothetical protein